jgi:hypothetical protein
VFSARLEYKEQNLGSGGGWHRDSIRTQFKAIMYVSDVSSDHGPFEMIIGSHGIISKIMNYITSHKGFAELRYSENYINKKYKGRERVLTGSAGDLLLVDTSCLHRGMPINAGIRYAVTGYYLNQSSNLEIFRKSVDYNNNCEPLSL